MPSPERVQVGAQQARQVAAAGRSGSAHHLVVGQDQIDHLVRFHLERPFAQERLQGIGGLVFRHLENSFVHSEEDEAGGGGGGVPQHQAIAGADLVGYGEIDVKEAGGAVDDERCHRVAQGADENLLRIEIAHEGDIDIGVALQIVGDADACESRVGVGTEPLERVDPIPFDGDESGAGVRSGDLEKYLVAGPVLSAVELEVEFRIALQVAGEVGGASHRELNAAQLAAVGVEQFQRVPAGLRGG